MNPLLLVLGVVMLAVVAHDAISTTVSMSAAAGPLTSRLGAGWWSVARRLARHPGSPMITTAGPVVVLLTIGCWLLLLWGGWTLVFSADPQAVVSSSTQVPAAGWSRAYYAGFTVFTLGVGDYVPNGQLWEVLTAVAVMTGLGLTTLAITYLVPVVSAVVARRVQANTIAGMGATPQDIVTAGLQSHAFPYLDHRLQALSDSLLETAERHLAYPVLHYFHSADRRVDLRAQARVLDEAVTMLQHGVAEDLRPHPAVLDSVRHAIAELVERATDGHGDRAAPQPPLLTRLGEAGLRTVDDADYRRSVDGIADHRRRVAHFANESLWPADGRSDASG